MKELNFYPELYTYQHVSQFLKDFPIEEDIIITVKAVFDRFFPVKNFSKVIYLDNFSLEEPTDEMIDQIILKTKEFAPAKRIVAIGGGSCMDTAKLVSVSQDSVEELFEGQRIKKRCELMLIPTTCGTGSEVTNIAALKRISLNTKIGFAAQELYGQQAILIAELIEELPEYVFATSSIDALIHAIESVLSPNASHLSMVFSYTAIEMIVSGYRQIEQSGLRAVLKKRALDFLLASTYAGLAFSVGGCAAVHALSYPIGGVYNVPHGEANYLVFLPVLRKYEALSDTGELVRLKNFLGNLLQTEEDAFEALDQLLFTLLNKRDLRPLGFNEETITDFTASVLANQQRLLKNNFVPLTETDIKEIYYGVYSGGRH